MPIVEHAGFTDVPIPRPVVIWIPDLPRFRRAVSGTTRSYDAPALQVIPAVPTSSISRQHISTRPRQEQRLRWRRPQASPMCPIGTGLAGTPHALDIALALARRKAGGMSNHRRFHQAGQDRVHPTWWRANSIPGGGASSGSSRAFEVP